MYLAFKRMPLALRILTILLVIDGAVRVSRWTFGQFGGEPQRTSMLTTGLLFAASAVLLFRGRRLGLEWMLGYGAVMAVMMVYGLIRGELVQPWTIVAAVVLLAGTAYFAWCWKRLPWQQPGSYGHWMEDPDYRKGVASWFAERDRLLAQDRRSPPDPDELVRSLRDADSDDHEMVRQRLQVQKEHFAPAVLRALDDAKFRRRSPHLAMLIDMLPEAERTSAIPQLVACLDHLDDRERGNVLSMLAATGQPSVAELLVRELAGESSDRVAEGLTAALRANRLDPRLRAAIEPALRACIAREGAGHGANVTMALLDPETPSRLVDAALTGDGAALNGLAALGDAGLPLPDAARTLWRQRRDAHDWFWCRRLMPFVAATDEDLLQVLRVTEPHFGAEPDISFGLDLRAPRSCHVRALELLLDRDHVGIEALLERAVAMQLGEVSDEAATLRMRRNGVPTDWTPDGDDLTTPQRYLRALSFADSYTCNGGISHAIDCLDEADMAVLVPALDAIAPAPVRELWREALHAVAPNGLPADHESRQELLMERHAEIADQLDELSNRYFRSKWRLYVAMATYATANRDQLAS